MDDLAREKVLAGPRRSRNQKRKRCAGERDDAAPKFSHRETPAPVEASGHLRGSSLFQCAAHELRQALADRGALPDGIVQGTGPQPASLLLERDLLVSGGQDDREIGMPVSQTLEDIEPLPLSPLSAQAPRRRAVAQRFLIG